VLLVISLARFSATRNFRSLRYADRAEIALSATLSRSDAA
jgi:hypothetical protein